MTERAPTARELSRAETTAQILDIARAHLAVDGTHLSLRAVARDLGVVSSAVYRYFASRDELLTALVQDAVASLGEAIETSEAAVARRDVVGRFYAHGRAARAWAYEHPHEFALLHGSPALSDAAGPPLHALLEILADGVARGALQAPADRLPRAVRDDAETLAGLAELTAPVPAALVARALSMWTLLCGTISFELSGHFADAIGDPDAWFEHQLRMAARYLGL